MYVYHSLCQSTFLSCSQNDNLLNSQLAYDVVKKDNTSRRKYYIYERYICGPNWKHKIKPFLRFVKSIFDLKCNTSMDLERRLTFSIKIIISRKNSKYINKTHVITLLWSTLFATSNFNFGVLSWFDVSNVTPSQMNSSSKFNMRVHCIAIEM